MNKYEITPSVNYGNFTDFIYSKLKENNTESWKLRHKASDVASDIMEESEEIYTENDCIWKVIVSKLSNDYLKEFTEVLGLKEDYYIIFTD